MSKVWVLQHAECETLGIIANALENEGVTAEYIRAFDGQPVPQDMGDASGLIVMGGPMGVYQRDTYPHLSDELRLIEHALQTDIPILGVCLGSQLLAAALGAPVTPGPRKEIGWYPVSLTEGAQEDALLDGIQSPFTAFHWHGDVYTLPHGAVPLASSEMTAYQAFRYGNNAYGFLFHMETTAAIATEMTRIFANELHEAGVEPSTIQSGVKAHLSALNAVGATVFGRWAETLSR